jgi:hypothetical protein
MSELQIGLIALGVVMIGVVLGLNWWQDRRVRRKMQENFPPSREDPLLGDQQQAEAPRRGLSGKMFGEKLRARKVRSEKVPGEKARSEPVVGSESVEVERREPAWDGSGDEPVFAAASAEASSVASLRQEPAGRIKDPGSRVDDPDEPDEACEAVIDVVFPQPVSGRDLLPHVRDIRQVGQKPMRAFFRTTDNVHFSSLRLNETYASMQIAVLMANRSGALSATEWAQAWAVAQRVADQFEAEIEGPDPKEVSSRARQLDEICAALDTSVGLTLVPQSPQPWRIPEVLAAARKAGFTENAEGNRLEWLDDDGAVRFTLVHPAAEANASGAVVGRLSLLLDVPRSPASNSGFADMAQVARQLATTLDAGVVDDNGLPLAQGSEGTVDTQLARLYVQLAQSGLPAGSERALRVFA